MQNLAFGDPQESTEPCVRSEAASNKSELACEHACTTATIFSIILRRGWVLNCPPNPKQPRHNTKDSYGGRGLQSQSNSMSCLWVMLRGDTALLVLPSFASLLALLRREVGGWGAAVLNPNPPVLPESLLGLNILLRILVFKS